MGDILYFPSKRRTIVEVEVAGVRAGCVWLQDEPYGLTPLSPQQCRAYSEPRKRVLSFPLQMSPQDDPCSARQAAGQVKEKELQEQALGLGGSSGCMKSCIAMY